MQTKNAPRIPPPLRRERGVFSLRKSELELDGVFLQRVRSAMVSHHAGKVVSRLTGGALGVRPMHGNARKRGLPCLQQRLGSRAGIHGAGQEDAGSSVDCRTREFLLRRGLNLRTGQERKPDFRQVLQVQKG